MAFDFLDTFMLGNRLTTPELRREILWAERNLAMINVFHDTPYLYMLYGVEYPPEAFCFDFPFSDYIQICLDAIEAKRRHKATIPAPPGRINVEAIKASRDIVAEIERHTQLRKSGRRFCGRCPLHEDKHPSLVVYPEQQTWHCFQCGKGGDIIDFIQSVENCDFRQAAAILGGP
jgi:DNA primase